MTHDQLSKLRDGHLVSSTDGTARDSGTGLGLAICREIVEAQGGRVEIESALGKGTSVTVITALG
jgi:signal transduction histidine kinase